MPWVSRATRLTATPPPGNSTNPVTIDAVHYIRGHKPVAGAPPPGMARLSIPEILRHPITSHGRALAIANIEREPKIGLCGYWLSWLWRLQLPPDRLASRSVARHLGRDVPLSALGSPTSRIAGSNSVGTRRESCFRKMTEHRSNALPAYAIDWTPKRGRQRTGESLNLPGGRSRSNWSAG